MKSNSKAQEAMEYLINYGWVILVVLAIGLSMWYLGIFETCQSIVRTSGFTKIKPLEQSIIFTPDCNFSGVFAQCTGHVINISEIIVYNTADEWSCNAIEGIGEFEPGEDIRVRANSCCSKSHSPCESYILKVNISYEGQIAGISIKKKEQGVIYGTYSRGYNIFVETTTTRVITTTTSIMPTTTTSTTTSTSSTTTTTPTCLENCYDGGYINGNCRISCQSGEIDISRDGCPSSSEKCCCIGISSTTSSTTALLPTTILTITTTMITLTTTTTTTPTTLPSSVKLEIWLAGDYNHGWTGYDGLREVSYIYLDNNNIGIACYDNCPGKCSGQTGLSTSFNPNSYCIDNLLEVKFQDASGVNCCCGAVIHRACINGHCCQANCPSPPNGCTNSVRFRCSDWSCV